MPPSLFQVHPLDTTDQQYLDSKFARIVNPLKYFMKIELYNEKWLREKGENTPTYSTIDDKSSGVFDRIVFHPHPDISYLSTRKIYQESGTSPTTPSVKVTPTNQKSTSSPLTFKDEIIQSIHWLFFITYTSSGTMKS